MMITTVLLQYGVTAVRCYCTGIRVNERAIAVMTGGRFDQCGKRGIGAQRCHRSMSPQKDSVTDTCRADCLIRKVPPLSPRFIWYFKRFTIETPETQQRKLRQRRVARQERRLAAVSSRQHELGKERITDMAKHVFTIGGMTCEKGCGTRVVNVTKKVAGVQAATLAFDAKQLTVEGDFKTDDVVGAIAKAGFQASQTA